MVIYSEFAEMQINKLLIALNQPKYKHDLNLAQ